MFLEHTCIALIIATAPPIQAPDRPSDLMLIADGRPACVIVYPAASDADRHHARRLAEAIHSLGTSDVPILPDTEAVPRRLGPVRDDLQDKSLILLGSLNTNRAVFPLYANYYTYCDALYPGGEGYAVHTIVRPFGRDTCYLMVAGSTPAGTGAAVEHTLTRLQQLRPGRRVTLPYTHDIRLGPEMTPTFAPYLDEAASVDAAEPPPGGGLYNHKRQQFTRNAHLFFYTGRTVFAERARHWAMQLAEHDEHAIRISDYDLENLVAAWRRVMFHPAFSAEDRQLFNTRLLETAQNLERAWWRTKDASPGIGGRHHTTGMLAWWTLIRTLLDTAPLDAETTRQLTQWRRECEAYLDGLLRHYSDDLDDYQSADSAQNIASYALQNGRLAWYESGLARDAARRVMAVTDNLGSYAGIQGYGEALPGWERFTLNAGLLLGSCAFLYADESYRWPLVHYPALERSWGALQPWGLHQYATGQPVPDDPPDWLRGSHVLRFTPYRLSRIKGGDFLQSSLMDGYYVEGLAVPELAEASAFDKLVMRDHPDPSSMYLLLQGSSAIALSVIDMNALIRLTDQGAIWLLHNTARRSLYFKNAVYISKGLNNEPLPAVCELVAHNDYEQVSLAASRLPGYRDTTWTRNLIVLQDHFAVVIDQIRADASGTYHVSGTWRTPATAELTGSAWQSQQDDVTFSLLPGEMAGAFSERSAERDGATRPTVLRQNRTFEAQTGDDLFLENLLYTSGPHRTRNIAIRRVAPGAIAIRCRTGESASLYLAAAGQSGIHIGTIETDASILLIGPKKAWLSGHAEHAAHAERSEASQSPTARLLLDDLELAAPSGELTLTETQADQTQRILKQLWETGHAPRHAPTEPLPRDLTVRPVWTHPGPSPRGGRIDGIRFKGIRHVSGPTMAATDWILPVLRAEPRLSPQRGSGSTFETSPPTQTTQPAPGDQDEATADILLSPLEGAEFILDLPARMRIDELALFGDTFGKTTPLPQATLEIEIIAERDTDSSNHRQRQRMTLTRESTWHNLYKGHCYVFECYRAVGLNLEASRLRIRVFNGPAPSLILSDVQLFAAQPGPDKPVHARVLDLDSDGTNEILTWTSAGDIVCVNHDGTLRWRDHRPAGIIALDAWNLDNDDAQAEPGERAKQPHNTERSEASPTLDHTRHAERGDASHPRDGENHLELFISRTDRQIDVLNSDGTLRWTKDFSDMHAQTDERFYGDGTAVYGMAAWQPVPSEAIELLFTSYFYMARLTSEGSVIDHARRSGHFTQILAVPQGFPRSGDLVMRSDIPWVGPVPLEWWSRQTGRPDATCQVPNGRIVYFNVNDYDRDGHVEALVATDEGVGLYAPTAPHTRWQHLTEAPPVGVGTIFAPSNAPATIIYARHDGYVGALDSEGRLLRDTFLDEPARCLTAIHSPHSGPLILVGTSDSLQALRLSDLSLLWQQPGTYQHLTPLHPGQAHRSHPDTLNTRVIAVTRQGTLEAFDR